MVKKDRALKTSQAEAVLKNRVTVIAKKWAAAGLWPAGPVRHSRPAGRRFKRLCFAGCGMSRTTGPASLIENIIFSINNTSEFFISKLPGKS